MKFQMNLTTSYDDVIRFASAQDLQNFYRRYGLDGLEVMPLPYSSAEAPGDYLSPELCPLLTPDMIKNARILAQEEGADCEFTVMDAENPEFPDDTFDVIISRNLTWTLPHVRHAYQEWLRVLRKGGVLLNFDANYGITDFSNVEDLPENHAHNMLGNEMMRECEEIKRQLPISSYSRPAWDLETLGAMSLKEFHVDLGISSRIYLEKDEFYNPTPLFMLRTVK